MEFFKSKGYWLKGALHVHSNFSDGSWHIDELIKIYKDHGYDFLVVTDHRKVNKLYNKVDDFVIIEGTEIDVPGMLHIVLVGAKKDFDANVVKTPEEAIEFAKANSEFFFFAHPYWSDKRTDFQHTGSFHTLEVFNAVAEMDVGRGYSEYFWDAALTDGHKMNAVAVDDSHQRNMDYCLGWVNVKVKEKTQKDIIEALQKGHYYSSIGPEIIDISVTQKPVLDKIENAIYNSFHAVAPKDGCTGSIQVKTSPCKQIRFICETDCGSVFRAKDKNGIQLAELQLRGEERYVRIECIDFDGNKAWSNPLYFENKR
ncbi:MAG: hypothetical protein A3J83_00830 [Elusimicrobia bacterium RIFOXYA2_FULL_40_6]|nr:MAG: hypothetical protein A3J83_00830 [Elusimicrobia bacterium RIFOXYA2_FULL_40_6]